MLKKLLLAVGVVGICVGVYLYTQNVTTTDMFASIIDKAQPIFSFIKQYPWVIGIIGSIGTIFGGLIINHLNNKKIQAKNTQVEALQSKGFTDEAVIGNLQTQLQKKDEQIKMLQEGVPQQVSTLTSQLQETQRQLDQKNEQIQRLNQDIGTLQNVITDLKMKERIVVK